MNGHFLRWSTKCGATFVVLVGICSAVSLFAVDAPVLPGQTTDAITDQIFSRYLSSPRPNIAIVGSSLAYRLKEKYFKRRDIDNLAIPGGSSRSALSIIVAQKTLPKVIAIETNIMSRNVDAELVTQNSPSERRPFTNALRPVRTAVAYFQTRGRPLPAYNEDAIKAILARPLSEFDNAVYIHRTLEVWDKTDFRPAMLKEADELKKVVDLLEQRGAKVVLFELPYAPPITASKYVRDARTVIQNAFGTTEDRWLHLKCRYQELRWDDGAHLDERSAVVVAQALERALSIVPAAHQITN